MLELISERNLESISKYYDARFQEGLFILKLPIWSNSNYRSLFHLDEILLVDYDRVNELVAKNREDKLTNAILNFILLPHLMGDSSAFRQ